ncbi:FprA family A-type flavoprotein [Candidatus Fermentibacteria bacterium]|nr:FprA family A-type flavoprotein [Candidatus Fermentibacteria bacterium]
MSAVKMCDGVYWVGAIDWGIRNFHGYSTHRGTTYNAFLVMADRVTLVDTVKEPFFDEMMSRIRSVTDPASIDTLVSNHSEMDHSGCIPRTVGAVSPDRIVASKNGKKALFEHFGELPGEVEPVSDGGEISLGDMNLRFYETKMLHWPDSMVSFLPQRKVLFSQDGFGMHLASTERFDDQLPLDVLWLEAARYYANILLPFSPLVLRLAGKLSELDLDVELLCPDHGPAWRENIGGIIGRWASWARQTPSLKAVVVYDSMWGSTERMARAVEDGLVESRIAVRSMPLGSSNRSDIATEVLDAGALVVGSPTMNNQPFPTLADCLTYLKGLKPRNLTGAAFGSYGWSGEAVKIIEEQLGQMGVELVSEGVRTLYVPDRQALLQCKSLGRSIGDRLHELCEAQ